jgi:hypothetical protein
VSKPSAIFAVGVGPWLSDQDDGDWPADSWRRAVSFDPARRLSSKVAIGQFNCPGISRTTALRRFGGCQGSRAGFRRRNRSVKGVLNGFLWVTSRGVKPILGKRAGYG